MIFLTGLGCRLNLLLARSWIDVRIFHCCVSKSFFERMNGWSSLGIGWWLEVA